MSSQSRTVGVNRGKAGGLQMGNLLRPQTETESRAQHDDKKLLDACFQMAGRIWFMCIDTTTYLAGMTGSRNTDKEHQTEEENSSGLYHWHNTHCCYFLFYNVKGWTYCCVSYCSFKIMKQGAFKPCSFLMLSWACVTFNNLLLNFEMQLVIKQETAKWCHLYY